MADKSTRLLLWVGALGLALLAALVLGVVLLMQDELPGQTHHDRWLYARLGALPDAPSTPGIFDDPAALPPLSGEVTQLVRDAASDDTVPGLLLDLSDLELGLAQAEELRRALGEFRAKGKRCIAWAESWTNINYLVGSACDEVQVMPTGVLLVNGLAMTHTYYAGTFEKLGVRANFEHVGDFKSAVEPYERTGPSEAASLANETLLDSLYGQLIQAIAEGRGLSTEQAIALVDQPPLAPAEALERGMVDRLSFRDQLRDQVELHGGVAPAEDAAAVDEESRKKVQELDDYLKKRRKAWNKRKDKRVAVLHAEGTIVNGSSGESLFGGSVIGDRSLGRQIRELREDESVIAVVLRVNSPGGSGSASDAIARELELTRSKKPVVVSMGNYAASGGYYISMGANWIVAEPGTLTGSIGVFGGKINLSGLLTQVGLNQHTWQRGRQATLLSGMHDFDEAGRETFRTYMQAFYDRFLDGVARGRNLSRDEAHAVAQGRVWTGEQALGHRLVDQLGGEAEAIQKALELSESGLSREQVRVVRYPERKSFFEQLVEELEGKEPSVSIELGPAARDPQLRRALAHLESLRLVLGEGELAAMLPGTVELR